MALCLLAVRLAQASQAGLAAQAPLTSHVTWRQEAPEQAAFRQRRPACRPRQHVEPHRLSLNLANHSTTRPASLADGAVREGLPRYRDAGIPGRIAGRAGRLAAAGVLAVPPRCGGGAGSSAVA